MGTRSATSTALIVCLVIFTFPLWIGIGAGLFGVIVGMAGAVFGIIAGILGAILGIVLIPFKVLFGWGHGGWFPFFHFPGLLLVTIIVLLVLLIQRRSR